MEKNEVEKIGYGTWFGQNSRIYSSNRFRVSCIANDMLFKADCNVNFKRQFGIKMGTDFKEIAALFNLELYEREEVRYCGYGHSDASFFFEFDQNNKLMNISYERRDDIY